MDVCVCEEAIFWHSLDDPRKVACGLTRVGRGGSEPREGEREMYAYVIQPRVHRKIQFSFALSYLAEPCSPRCPSCPKGLAFQIANSWQRRPDSCKASGSTKWKSDGRWVCGVGGVEQAGRESCMIDDLS